MKTKYEHSIQNHVSKASIPKTKTVAKIMEWNLIGMRSKVRPRNRWRDEVLNDLKKLKLRNWTYLVKAWCELVQRTEAHRGLWCQQKRKKKKALITSTHKSFQI
jgi:hypothetical protein